MLLMTSYGNHQLYLLKIVKVVPYQEIIHAQFFMVFDKENEKHIWEPPHTSPQVL